MKLSFLFYPKSIPKDTPWIYFQIFIAHSKVCVCKHLHMHMYRKTHAHLCHFISQKWAYAIHMLPYSFYFITIY